MARPKRVVLLSLGILLLAAAAAVAVAATEPSIKGMFARARRALRAQPALDSEADSPSSTPPRTPPAASSGADSPSLTGVATNAPPLLALPAASSEADPPYLTGVAPSSPAPRSPALLALPAAPTGHHGPPRAPPATPTSERRALPSGRTTAPTCTFVTYIGGGGTEVAEVVRGGDGRVFVVGPGSTWDKTLAAGSHQEPSTDPPVSDDSSDEEEEEEEEEEDDDVFTVLMDSFCEVFPYARGYHDALEWLMRRANA